MTKEEIEAEYKIIERCKSDVDAFRILYDRYHQNIFLFILKRISNQQLAAELTSTVFTKALLGLSKFKFRGLPFSAWLYRIAVNEVNLQYRIAKKENWVELTEKEVGSLCEESEIDYSNELVELLIECLNALPLEQSQLVEFRFFDSLSFKEIAEIYGASEASVKMKVYRIIEKLKREILRKRKAL